MDRAVLSKKLCSRESNNLKQNNRRPLFDKTNSIMEERKLEVKTRFGRIATRFSPIPNKLRNKKTSAIGIESSENEKLVESKKRTLRKETIGLEKQTTPEKKNVRKQANINIKAIGKENTDSKVATVSKPATKAVTGKSKQNISGTYKRSPVKGLTEDEIRHILESDDQPVSLRKIERQLTNCSSHTNVLNSKTDNLKETQTSETREKRSENKHFLRNHKTPNYVLLESGYLNNPELDPKLKNCSVAVERITKSLLASKCSNVDYIWQRVHDPVWKKRLPIIPDIDMKDQLRPSQKLNLYEFNCESPEETSTAPKRRKNAKQKTKQIKHKRTVKKVQGFKYVIDSKDRLGNIGKRWHLVGDQPDVNAKKFVRPVEIATSSTDNRSGNNVRKTRRRVQISVDNRLGDNARKLTQPVHNISSTNDLSDNNAGKTRQLVETAANCFAKPAANSYISLDEPFEMETHSPPPEMDYEDRASSRCSSVTSLLNHIDGLGSHGQPLQTSSPWRFSTSLSRRRRSFDFEVKSSNLLPSYNQVVSKSLLSNSESPAINERNSQSAAKDIALNDQQATPKKHLQQLSLLKYVTLSRKSSIKDNLSKVSGSRLSSQKSPRSPFRNITQNMCSTPNFVGEKNRDDNLRNSFSINQKGNISPVWDKNIKQNIQNDNIAEKENTTYSDDGEFFVEKDNSLNKNRENIQNKQTVQNENNSEKEIADDSDESDFFVEEDNCNLNKNTGNCKPTRISYSDIKKLKEGARSNEDDFENVYIEPENVTLPSPVPDTCETNDDKNVGLFEDLKLKVNKANRTYNSFRLESNRTHKALRFETSVSSDEDSDGEKKPKKRKKRNARTKKEIMEAAKWAREFNSMCKEVDDFELVIE